MSSVEARLGEIEHDLTTLREEVAQLGQTIRSPGHWWEELRALREEVRDLRTRLDALSTVSERLATVATRQEGIARILDKVDATLTQMESGDTPLTRAQEARALATDPRAQLIGVLVMLLQALQAALVVWMAGQ